MTFTVVLADRRSCNEEEVQRAIQRCLDWNPTSTMVGCMASDNGVNGTTITYQCNLPNPKPGSPKKEPAYEVPIPFVQAVDCPCGVEYSWEQIMNPKDIVYDVYTISNTPLFRWNNGRYEDPNLAQVHYLVAPPEESAIKLVCGDTLVSPEKLPKVSDANFLFYQPGCFPIVYSGTEVPERIDPSMYLSSNNIKIKKIFSCQGDPRIKK